MMPDARFRRPVGGVGSLGLHLVWCPKYRRRLLGGRVAVRIEATVRRYIEHQWDQVA
ncbi:MAG: transposase [Acidimicrobiales bacterium]